MEFYFLYCKAIVHCEPNGVCPICKPPFPNGSYRNGVCKGFRTEIKIFLPKYVSSMVNISISKSFSKKVLYNLLMGCLSFSNYHFQMGVTVMGFAEDFGLCLTWESPKSKIILAAYACKSEKSLIEKCHFLKTLG